MCACACMCVCLCVCVCVCVCVSMHFQVKKFLRMFSNLFSVYLQEKDETDSGYRSGTIPDEKLPKAPSQATLNRMELRRKIQSFNHFVPKATLEMVCCLPY